MPLRKAKFPDQYDWVPVKVLNEAIHLLIQNAPILYSDEFTFKYMVNYPLSSNYTTSTGFISNFPMHEEKHLIFRRKMLNHPGHPPRAIWHLETPINFYIPEKE